jgi:hypothetical protein
LGEETADSRKNADGNDPKIRQDFMQEVYKDRKKLETIKLST